MTTTADRTPDSRVYSVALQVLVTDTTSADLDCIAARIGVHVDCIAAGTGPAATSAALAALVRGATPEQVAAEVAAATAQPD